MEKDSIRLKIESSIQEHETLTKQLYDLSDDISEIAEVIRLALKNGRKTLWMGNGGSAADCQHLVAELVGRFEAERRGLAAIALTTDTSILTSISNDYGFAEVFRRQIEALCNTGDVVIGISTSGGSQNVINALRKANELGATTIGFTGKKEAQVDEVVQFCLKIPSVNTARTQELHILCGHIICDLIETSIFGSN